MNLSIADERQNPTNDEVLNETVNNAVGAVCKHFGIKVPVEVSVMFTEDEMIREINEEYRGIDKVTDVLSFPQMEFSEAGVIDEKYMPEENGYPGLVLGDIILNVEQARKQADEYGHSFYREAGYLTVHSMLHLLGYDHEEDGDKKIMREKEEIIMSEIGLGRDAE